MFRPPSRFVEETDSAAQAALKVKSVHGGRGVATFDCDSDGLPGLRRRRVSKASLSQWKHVAALKLKEERSGLELTRCLPATWMEMARLIWWCYVGEIEVFTGWAPKSERAGEKWGLSSSNAWHRLFCTKRGQNWPALAGYLCGTQNLISRG